MQCGKGEDGDADEKGEQFNPGMLSNRGHFGSSEYQKTTPGRLGFGWGGAPECREHFHQSMTSNWMRRIIAGSKEGSTTNYIFRRQAFTGIFISACIKAT